MQVLCLVSWMAHLVLFFCVEGICLDHGVENMNCKTTCDTTLDCSYHDIHCPRCASCKECTIDCKHNKYCQNTRIFGNECDSITIINSNKRTAISNMTINTNHSSLLTLNTNGLIDSTIIHTKSCLNYSFDKNKEKEEKEARTRILCDLDGENIFLNNVFVLSNGLKFLCDDFSALTFSSNLIYLSNKQELIEFLKSLILLNNSLIFDKNEFYFVKNYKFSKQFTIVCDDNGTKYLCCMVFSISFPPFCLH